jgi:hypothetical protein
MIERQQQHTQPFTDELPAHHPQLETLRRAWSAKASLDRLPSRDDFSPADLKPWLRNVAIIEMTGKPARFRIRSMGLACMYLAGGDLTGQYIDACIETADREKALEPYHQCAHYGIPIFSNAVYVKQGISRTIVHRLYLPCADNGRRVDGMLVGAYSLEEAGRFYGTYEPVPLTLTKI